MEFSSEENDKIQHMYLINELVKNVMHIFTIVLANRLLQRENDKITKFCYDMFYEYPNSGNAMES